MKQVKHIAVIALLFAVSLVNAQGRQGRNGRSDEVKQKILENKIAFLKENLMLDKQESIDFEKAYREYDAKREALQEQYRAEVIQKVRRGKANDLSEKEQMAIIEKKLLIDEKKYQLKRNFTIKLTKIMAPAKVIRYFKLEREFRRKMMKRLKHHRGGNMRGGMRDGKTKGRRM